MASTSQVGSGDVSTLFDRTCFVYDADNDMLTCPAGQQLQRKQIPRKDKMVTKLPARTTAAAVRSRPSARRARRMVSCHQYDAALQRMNARATPALMRLRRSTVEYPFGILKYQILQEPRVLLRGLWGYGAMGRRLAFA
jgi:transposase